MSNNNTERFKEFSVPQMFNVYERGDYNCKHYLEANRKDFYKITLIIGEGTLSYANKSIQIRGHTLLLSNPFIPYGWEAISEKQLGYFCVFKEDFIISERNGFGLLQSPLFKIGHDPVYQLTPEQSLEFQRLFEKMMVELDSDYKFKYELCKSYVNQLIHYALKLSPKNDKDYQSFDSSERITQFFMEALEKQFPIETPRYPLKVVSPSDYAKILNVHVNHLNRCVKRVTGNTTSELIGARILGEAKSLLKFTDWPIADIGHAMGFEEASYFSNFFNAKSGIRPSAFRKKYRLG